MNTAPQPVGIDVGAKELVLAYQDGVRSFPNTPRGQAHLVRTLARQGPAQVVVEATGVYHVAITQRLHDQTDISVMVVNPHATHHFAKTLMTRGKSDPLDAQVLQQFARRMDFVPWQPPSPVARRLRALTRRIQALTEERTAEQNRLHATTVAGDAPEVVADIQDHLGQLRTRIAHLRDQAEGVVSEDATLVWRYQRLQEVPGMGRSSALSVLGELSMLPAEMGVRQWVAHAGLDPIPDESGYSRQRPRKMSRRGNAHLRTALYFPALTAIRCDPVVKAHYDYLHTTRRKKKMVAVVAIMRKLLHAIYGMFQHDDPFDANKCFRAGNKSARNP